MSITFTATAAEITATAAPHRITERIAAVVRAAVARRTARRDYQRMLEREDHLLRDMGVTRAEVRRALGDC
jgi:uncharacterized protein YjiS (DUF1127 family)